MPPVEEADVPVEALSRRRFLELVGAGALLAGAGCAERPARKIIPYRERPEDLIPGLARRYATSFVRDGLATGLLVTSHTGRPTKIEGNPEHPASLGATSAIDQASILGLYDPQRAKVITSGEQPRAFSEAVGALRSGLPPDGAGLAVLMDPTSSPLEIALLGELRRARPAARVTFLSPPANALEGARLALGQPLVAHADLSRADVVLSLGADFTCVGPDALRLARQLADRRRRPDDPGRLWMVETSFTPTGSLADRRLRARPSEIYAVAAALYAGLRPGALIVPEGPADPAWTRALVDDLLSARGRAAVLVGDEQPPEVHALGRLIDAALGNPVVYRPSPIFEAATASHDLAALTREMASGAITHLLVLAWNPVYQAPVDLGFGDALSRVGTSLYLGAYRDETTARAGWHVPALHFLESWGDARGVDGTVSTIQPLIAPLVDGAAPADLLAALIPDLAEMPLHDRLVAAWRGKLAWEDTLARGFVEGSALPPVDVEARFAAARAFRPPPGGPLEIALCPDAKVGDGRFANNGWLQELPAPITKLTWDNAALLSPRTAAALGVATGDHVELALAGRALVVPALVLPGHADAAVTLSRGYGRQGQSERLAHGVGRNANVLRTQATLAGGPGGLRRAAGHTALAITQGHDSQEGRPLALVATLAEARAGGEAIRRGQRGPLASLLADSYTEKLPHQWAMTIDLGVCTGCSACVVACQAENNTPVVGRAGVLRSREMHWLRIDRYFTDGDDPTLVHQPMLCQHCEKAPCEYVCPVNATVHSADGLNEMVYNRCIGTRFCSNNCPYKVRRFNFFSYVARDQTALQKNPNVTVRQRGVMEKCTYCVQRIRGAEIAARRDGRELGGDDVQTACQQACPTRAIVFGSLTDPASQVARLREDPRAYEVLHDLGTRPRTRYLVKLVNP